MSQAIKVALVEDDPVISNMYLTKLEQEGCEVQTAGDGNAALDLLYNFRPQVVVLDIMMPNINGIDFLQNFRRTKENDDIKIIIFTNLDDVSLRKSLDGMKISAYMVKAATNPSALVAKIREIVG